MEHPTDVFLSMNDQIKICVTKNCLSKKILLYSFLFLIAPDLKTYLNIARRMQIVFVVAMS